jgi:hypothetical protein
MRDGANKPSTKDALTVIGGALGAALHIQKIVRRSAPRPFAQVRITANA